MKEKRVSVEYRHGTRIRILGLVFVLWIFGVWPVTCRQRVYAAESGQKTVRVGYVNALNYEEGGAGEYKRGSGYEYLQQISYRTGWNYEYVYGSFKECYEMLAKGEIDLFGNVSYTPERENQILYSSYPQGKDIYLIYTTKDRMDLLSDNIRNLNGCRIGVTGGSFQEGLLKDWLEHNHLEAAVEPLNGYNALMGQLREGNLDAIVTPDLSINYDLVSVANIGFSEYYFGVSRQRPDLLQELNEALYEIQNTEKDFNSQLVNRYYNRMTSALLLNETEKAWVAERNNTLRLGYLADDLPFCGEENGRMVGVMQTVAEAIEDSFGVKIETVPYQNLDQMRQALGTGEVDVAGPVISDFYLAEQENLVLTNGILESTPVVVYKGKNAEESLKTIALAASSVFEPQIMSVLFPDSELYPCETQEDCLQAVADGKVGSTIVLSSRLNILRSVQAMEGLSFAEMSKRVDICFVTTKENRKAAAIVNKGIVLSYDVLNGVVLSQHSVADRSITFKDFASQHAGMIVTVAGTVILILGILIYSLSISQKRLVAALAEARSASVAKTSFLSNMSHDIRTPMNAIIGFTNIALKQDPKPQIKNCLEKIEESSEHLLALINDVLDISRIESGKIQYTPVPVDIVDVTDSVLNIMNGFLVNRDLKFEVHRETPENRYVLADAVRIREILVNILGNAVKFTEDGGRITFEEQYLAGVDTQHVRVRYRVADTGIGMSEEFMGRLFDEFAQEFSGARTRYQGTGLGLAITRRYVELMGGTISAESKKGAGSTFVVELPLELTDPAEIREQALSMAQISLKGVHVLLAEDNDLNAEIAQVQMEEYGMQVTRAADGAEAVKLFAEHPTGSFDLIFMDIMMPHMDGYEAAKAIRAMDAHPDAQTIPIIAMTANAFAEDIQASMEAGMNAHLSKPIVMEEVIRTITRNLNR